MKSKHGVSSAQGSRLLGRIRDYAFDCLERQDLGSFYRFCEQFSEIAQSIEAENEAIQQDLLAGLYF